jgi:hypothetical protein
MPLNRNSDQLSLSSPTLQIDFRSGSVVMRLGSEVWYGPLNLNPADMSQVSTVFSEVTLEKLPSGSPPDLGASSVDPA